MKYVFRSIFLLVAILPSTLMGSDESETMTFSLVPPEQPSMIFGNEWQIYAEGFVDMRAADRLESLIHEKEIPPYSILYLNSRGGSLFGGIDLGRIINKYGLSTSVGSLNNQKGERKDSATCFSACTFAYLGGKFRYFSDRNRFGVHRFYSSHQSGDAEDRAQIVSASILEYLQEVGIPEQFFIEMSRAGPQDLVLLSKDELENIGIVNNGFEKVVWTLEALPGPDSALYLKGERDTRYGINKFLILCNPKDGELDLHIIFDPRGRQDEVMGMSAISLVIDSHYYPFAQFLEGAEIVNGWLNAVFSLNEEFIEKISRSGTVGIAFQMVYDAPFFLGFQHMEFEDGRPLLNGLRAACTIEK